MAHQELTQYIESTRQMIMNSIPSTVPPSTTTVADSSEITSTDDEEIFDDDDEWLNGKFTQIMIFRIFQKIFKSY